MTSMTIITTIKCLRCIHFGRKRKIRFGAWRFVAGNSAAHCCTCIELPFHSNGYASHISHRRWKKAQKAISDSSKKLFPHKKSLLSLFLLPCARRDHQESIIYLTFTLIFSPSPCNLFHLFHLFILYIMFIFITHLLTHTNTHTETHINMHIDI